jgi:hypothetical protein
MSLGKIESVIAQGASELAVQWDDGTRDEIDLGSVIAAHPALAPLADPAIFHGVRLSDDGWSVEWSACGVDFGAPQLRRWADEHAGRTMSHEAFRAWMQHHALTLDGAADALGLSRRTIAYYLSGEQPVPKTVMLATEGYNRRVAA